MIIMVFGTFDILHKGHLDFFRQAKKIVVNTMRHSDRAPTKSGRVEESHSREISRPDQSGLEMTTYSKLIVVVARDGNVKKFKNHLPKFDEKIRIANVKKLKVVDKTILGDKKDFFKAVKRERPNVICLGYDQKMRVAALKNKLRALGLKTNVYRLKAYKPQIYKSSKIRNLIKSLRSKVKSYS